MNRVMNLVSSLVFMGLSLGMLAFVAFAWNVRHAPEGYEDDDGFHPGEEPQSSCKPAFGGARYETVSPYGSGEEKVTGGSLVRAA